jgi:hypothetical protein
MSQSAAVTAPPQEVTVASDLLLGAGPIALFIYGEDTPDTRRNVYRNPFGFSFFKHGAIIAALKTTIRAELTEAQQAARQKKSENLKPPLPKRRRYRRGADEAAA